MNQKILTIFTRTPLHIGAGSSVGAIDSPIQRERHTGFPIIPGSSIKGVLRDTARRDETCIHDVDAIFGIQENAGTVSIGEAKILTFPVRSAKGSYAFITCPLALERFKRDSRKNITIPKEPDEMTCLAGKTVLIKTAQHEGAVLEEYRFNKAGDFPVELEKELLSLLSDEPVWQGGKGRFVLLSNGDFAHFVKNACEVAQHVGLDPEKGTARKGALFNLEAVPSETLFFTPLTSLGRENGEFNKLATLLENTPLLQFGGDSTTGLGFCSVKLA